MSMDTTFQELLDMRQRLDDALEAKIGRRPMSGFNIEVHSAYGSKISFCHARPSLEEWDRLIVSADVDSKATPQEAYDLAMARIAALDLRNPDQERAEKIARLKARIKELEAEK